METIDVVKKLIGSVRPVGETNEDEQVLKNMKELCELCSNILIEINNVHRTSKGFQQHSIKKVHDHAGAFLNETQNFLVGR